MDQALSRWQPMVLSLFRFIAGLMLFQYGVVKILKFPPSSSLTEVEITSLFGIAGCFELVVGAVLLLGLYTRLAAFILSGEMAFAYFIEHAPVSFFPVINDGTAAILLCFGCLYLVFAGGGPYSLDAVIRKQA
jgi:putative oxidoreductase